MRLTIPLLTIALCVLGCGEGAEHEQPISAQNIIGLASVRDTLYVVDLWDGVWRLNNKTESWELILTDAPLVDAIAVDDNTLYLATSSGVYRLEPDGETFTRIIPESAPLLVADGSYFYFSWNDLLHRRKKDGGAESLEIPQMSTRSVITSIAAQGDNIFVSTYNTATFKHALFSSVDGGHSWTAINGVPFISSNPVTKQKSLQLYQSTLYITTRDGVYRLPIGTTTPIPAGLNDYAVISLLVESETTLYATASRKSTEANITLFRSDDGGKNWQNIGIEGFIAMAVFDNQLYVGSRSGEGVFYTDDAGATWHPLNKGLNLPSDEE